MSSNYPPIPPQHSADQADRPRELASPHDQLTQHALSAAQSYNYEPLHPSQASHLKQEQTGQQAQQQQQQLQQQPQQHDEDLHQHQQAQQQQPLQNFNQPRITPNEPLQLITSHGDSAKANRLRKACDSCSIRKVKCDESGPPCRACIALDIPCTFERPRRRRGPPNRHAEAIKKRRVDAPPSDEYSPMSPSHVAATLASFSSHAVLNAESICPFDILELLVDDFFTYIHPLVPFPHEPSFRAAFAHREDLNNPTFLALLASMIAVLVASFPRKPRLHFKAHGQEHLFPTSSSLVERCHKVAIEARGPGYLDKELTVYDAATSYFLSLASVYIFNVKGCRLYLAECLTVSRILGLHRSKAGDRSSIGTSSGFDGQFPEQLDFIRQEIGRRVFWTVFVGVRSLQQLGPSLGELLIPPPTRQAPYPPLPMEVDDQFIYVDHVDPQPAGLVSELVGFNLNAQVYLTCTPIARMELVYGSDELYNWDEQRVLLEESMRDVRKCLEVIPQELMINREHAPDRQYYPTSQEYLTSTGIAPQDRRLLQYEIQKANIYLSQLGTRSYITEKFWNLLEIHQNSLGTETSPRDNGSHTSGFDNIEKQMSNEREDIVQDLVRVLNSISQVNMEPNGASIINKIRSIASTLLDIPRNQKGPLALRAEEYLSHFLTILMRLERQSPTMTGSTAPLPPPTNATLHAPPSDLLGRDIGGAVTAAAATAVHTDQGNASLVSGSNGGVTAVAGTVANGKAVNDGDNGAVTSGMGWPDDEEELRSWADLRDVQARFAQAGGFGDEG